MTNIEQPTTDVLALRFFLAEGNADFPETEGEVEPYDASVGFRVPPTQTWTDSGEACRGLGAAKLPAPASWSAALAVEWPMASGWMAAGLHPQRIREFPGNGKLSPADRRSLLDDARAVAKSGSITAKLIASGMALIVMDTKNSSEILSGLDPSIPAVANQLGVVAAVAGDLPTAVSRWVALGDSYAPALFNRGLEAWNRSDFDAAAELFTHAAALIPEHSGWHHLARLYLILGQA